MRGYIQFTAFSLFGFSASLSIPSNLDSRSKHPFPALPLPHHVVYQFPDPTWLENLAIRTNGDILTTVVTAPHLYQITPSLGPSQTPVLLYSFPDVSSVLGITEVDHDIFYVAVQNNSAPTFFSTPGTSSIWEVDMRGLSHRDGPRVSKTVDIPEANFLNGATTLGEKDGTVLFADSGLGLAWKVNVRTKKYEIGPQVPEMHGNPPPGFPLGINGMKIKNGYLYFDNTALGTFYRVPISPSGAITGAVELLSGGLGPDDFALDHGGNAWICQNSHNIVSVRLKNGTVVTVLGSAGSLEVAGPTAAKFGRAKGDGDVLYVTTTGGLAVPVNGSITEGGKIVAIDTEGIEDL